MGAALREAALAVIIGQGYDGRRRIVVVPKFLSLPVPRRPIVQVVIHLIINQLEQPLLLWVVTVKMVELEIEVAPYWMRSLTIGIGQKYSLRKALVETPLGLLERSGLAAGFAI